jgi:hypothetical protein
LANRVWRLIHGVGFAGASVSIRKNGDVVAVKEVHARLEKERERPSRKCTHA